jgi:thiol-disulfide isomerase/thioredoxin
MICKLIITVVFSMLICACAPDAVDSHGRPIRISDYQGKWVVINYWATWCGPCIQEIPDLNKLAKYYRDKVVVLGVNFDQLNNAILNDLAQEYGVSYLFLSRFPIEKWSEKPVTIPVTYILDPHGKLFKILKGPQKIENFQSLMSLPPINYDVEFIRNEAV